MLVQTAVDKSAMLRTIIRTFGPPNEVVSCETYRPPTPGPGQVLVRMLLASVNPSDLIPITGAYRTRTPLPFVPGFEGVGLIESVGEGVSELKVGDRVLPLGSAGAWQETKVTEERWCFPVPTDLTNQQAAMAYINPLTARMLVKTYVPQSPTEFVAVNAATSAIGQMIIRMLNQVGVRPIALTSKADAQDRLENQFGLLDVICTSYGGLKRKLHELTGGLGLAVAYDAVGGSEGEELAHAVADGGTLVHYGLLSGSPLSSSLHEDCRHVRVVLFHLRDWVHSVERHDIQHALDDAFSLVRSGVAASNIAAVLPLSAIQQALELAASRRRHGKVLLSMTRGVHETTIEGTNGNDGDEGSDHEIEPAHSRAGHLYQNVDVRRTEAEDQKALSRS